MNWSDILVYVFGGSGVIGGLIALINSRANKESIAIDNIKKVIDEMKEHHDNYKKDTEEKFISLDKKLKRMELIDEIKQHAINSAYPCKFPPDNSNCPVTAKLDSAMDAMQNIKKGLEHK